jgi:hypothetical protein
VKNVLTCVVVVWCALSLSASAWAAARPGPEVERQTGEDLKRHWDEAKGFLKRGAYRDALQSLEIILTSTPDDPWAQLYHSLCELRLEAPPPFPPLSSTEIASLKGRLHREEQVQRRAIAQQKALERQLRNEQARWDKELATLQRAADRDEKRRRQQAQAEAITHTRLERAKARTVAKQQALRQGEGSPGSARGEPEEGLDQTGQEAVLREPVRPTAEEPPLVPGEEVPAPRQPLVSGVPSLPAPAPPKGGPGEQPIELSPVVVQTATAESGKEPPATPSLVGRVLPPPGAVQINARQMSVLSDRKLAIAEGDVEVVFENAILTCDHLTLFTDTKDVYPEGRVRLEEGNQVFRGEMAHYNLNTKKGRFLQGTVSAPPWHEYGRSVEHIAEGVYQVTPGYLTSCELEPPHFRFFGRRAIVFADDRIARARNVALFVEQVPFLYLPWLSVADRQSPFFLIPGKHKRWGQFALMGYRYEWPGPANQQGTVKLDWRRFFGWGIGADHKFESARWGKGLLKLYYNEEENRSRLRSELPKGADVNRYRLLWRHYWEPLPDTTVVTDIQEYSDPDFRQELLFREEFVNDDIPTSFISVIRNSPDYSLSGVIRKRMNRFQTATEAFPEVTLDTRSHQIGDTQFFLGSQANVANLQTKTAHSDKDADVVRLDWFQELKHALNWFRPIEVTPRAGVRQTYYTKDIQGGAERTHGKRDLISGQFSMGTDASLKLFRIFPVTTNAFGLNLNWLRHVLTPTVAYSYVHRPTVPNDLLNSATASNPTNSLSFGLENKLQTKRPGAEGKPQSVDLARVFMSLPYTFRGSGNRQGSRLGDWAFDVELYPWPWMRIESDWSYPSHFVKGTRDERITGWNLDVVIVGGRGTPLAQDAPDIQTPASMSHHPGPRGGLEFLMPQEQWYLGLGHRYSHNNKTEEVVQLNWRPSEKWEIETFHRLTWKEVSGSAKRFNNVREYQYTFRRDLHDWVAELVYRVDREYGEELFLTLTLKAYPNLPIEFEESYHQPKIGSQSSPFSPVH